MLPSERRDPATVGIDRLAPDEVVALLLRRLASVGSVVDAQASAIGGAVEAAIDRLRHGGRLVYVGSGTSGLIAHGDAAELPATFGWPADRMLVLRPEHSEASADEGTGSARAAELDASDVVVALSASGSTAFTVAALEEAVACGAVTIAIASNPGSPLGALADHAIEVVTGPEPIAGSTRMRAGLAHRLVLTALSSAAMIGLGRTHDNLMVEVSSTLPKLLGRKVTIVVEATGLDTAAAARLLDEADGEVKVALVMHLADVSSEAARRRLAGGATVHEAIAAHHPPSTP